MGICKDALTEELHSKGYSVVRLPRSNILPLDVIGEDGRTRSVIGRLAELWRAENAKSLDVEGGDCAEFAVLKTSHMKFGVGFSLLAPVLKALGMETPKLRQAYDGVHRLSIEFNEPTFQRVSILRLGEYLISGDLHIDNPTVQRYLLDGGCRTLVIVEVLQSSSITVETLDSGQSGVALNTTLVEGLGTADVSADVSKERDGVVTYTGTIPVTFAFKALPVAVQDGLWTIDGIDPHVSLAAEAVKIPASVPLDGDGLTDLN